MSRRAALLAATLSVVGATTARADDAPPPAPSAEDRAEAEKFYRAGSAAYAAGDYASAAQAFEQALTHMPVPQLLFSTAQAYRLWYVTDPSPTHVRRAVELYRAYVGEVKTGARVADAVEHLAALVPLLPALAAAPPPPVVAATQLMISSQIPGAVARLGEHSGDVPLKVDVAPGTYDVTVEAPGYFPATQRATAVESRFIVVEVDLTPRPSALDVYAEAGARIEVDGRAVGLTPLPAPLEVPAGDHVVVLTRRGREPVTLEVTTARGEYRALRATLQATGQRQAVPWVLLGAGALVAAAGGAGLVALRAQRDAEAIEATRVSGSITLFERADFDRAVARRDDARLIMWTLAGAGLLTATVGAMLYAFDTPSPAVSERRGPRTPTPVTPTLLPGGAGVVWRGAF